MREIFPYKNTQTIDKNVCYFTTNNNNIYLNINKYKYNVYLDCVKIQIYI